jgi:cytochrome d ubiquinol oxidase subunit II
LLAVGVCAYLAAVYLTADARRAGESDLAEYFRSRALTTGFVVGLVAVAGLIVVHDDAPTLFHEITHDGLILVVISGAAGLASIALLVARAYVAVRLTAALAVIGVLWAWAVGQQPVLLPNVTIASAAAAHATLEATAVSAVIGLAVLIPSMGCLFVLFQRERQQSSPSALVPDESVHADERRPEPEPRPGP